MKKSKPAVFLDRDGTLLTERGYLADPEKIFFYPTAIAALKRLQSAGYRLIVVTNQSGVARGYLTLATLKKINARFLAMLRAKGVRIDGIYFCPHGPDDGCRCRKPQPFLLNQAARKWKIPVAQSFVVGDQMTDINMAVAAGSHPVLVLTGSGRKNRQAALARRAKIASNFAAAAAWVLSRGPIR